MLVLFYGDIVGSTGRGALAAHLKQYRGELAPDLIIANGENASGGIGIEPDNAEDIFRCGVDVITTGNHIWQKNAIESYLNKNQTRFLRPANFPSGSPGIGHAIFQTKRGTRLLVINLIGRIFMPQQVDCPFRAFDRIISETEPVSATIVDFHAEATSEKLAFAYYVDGKASAVIGTHTHVQTADERVLPKGTAMLSDVGMCGARDSVLGFRPENIVKRFLSSRPYRMEVQKGEGKINACLIDIDENTNQARSITRLS